MSSLFLKTVSYVLFPFYFSIRRLRKTKRILMFIMTESTQTNNGEFEESKLRKMKLENISAIIVER